MARTSASIPHTYCKSFMKFLLSEAAETTAPPTTVVDDGVVTGVPAAVRLIGANGAWLFPTPVDDVVDDDVLLLYDFMRSITSVLIWSLFDA